MKYKKLRNNEHGVVGIVTTFLIIGLIVIILSLLQTTYIPKWMEQSESEHMEQVEDQFAQLKFSIDTQSVFKQQNIPIATSITLGNKEHPFLVSNRAYGSLEIISNSTIITVEDNQTNQFIYPLGTIKYSSSNAYYINQNFIYETGATIISQSDGNIMTIKPTFSVKKEKNITIKFTLIDITPIGNKKSMAGYGTYPIQTEYFDNENIILNNISKIDFQTNYQTSWKNFFNRALKNGGLNYAGDNTNYSINNIDDSITIEFIDNEIYNLEIKHVAIGAQIAPGWIENI